MVARAIYENGMFRPLEPLSVAEHSGVTLIVHEDAVANSKLPKGATWDELRKLATGISLEDLEFMEAEIERSCGQVEPDE